MIYYSEFSLFFYRQSENVACITDHAFNATDHQLAETPGLWGMTCWKLVKLNAAKISFRFLFF